MSNNCEHHIDNELKLLEYQERHLETLLWLLDEKRHRGEGRNYVAAVAFIRIAMRYPGDKINVYDPTSSERRRNRQFFHTAVLPLCHKINEALGKIQSDYTFKAYLQAEQIEFAFSLRKEDQS